MVIIAVHSTDKSKFWIPYGQHVSVSNNKGNYHPFFPPASVYVRVDCGQKPRPNKGTHLTFRFFIRLVFMGCKLIWPTFGLGLRSHGQQMDTPRVRLGPAPRLPTIAPGLFKCTSRTGTYPYPFAFIPRYDTNPSRTTLHLWKAPRPRGRLLVGPDAPATAASLSLLRRRRSVCDTTCKWTRRATTRSMPCPCPRPTSTCTTVGT